MEGPGSSTLCSQDWYRAGTSSRTGELSGIGMHEVRVDIGETLEISLVNAGQDEAVRGGQRRGCTSEEFVKILTTATTLGEEQGWKLLGSPSLLPQRLHPGLETAHAQAHA